MKHYVVLCESSVTLAYGGVMKNTAVSGVAHTIEEASKILKKASKDEKEYAMQNNWNIIADNDYEFNAGEKNGYDDEHCRFYIEEVDD